MTKVVLGLCMWVVAFVCKPKHMYVGTFLRTQLGFQKHKKGKFSAIMPEVWNESHKFSKPHFFNYKRSYMEHFQNTQKFHWKILRFTEK